jgi:hypothetical protein
LSKHTPGPWTAHHNGHYYDVGPACPESFLEVYPTVCIGVLDDQVNNLRLIAAAPELLEACKLIVSGQTKEGYIAANAAIAKAEGQTAA